MRFAIDGTAAVTGGGITYLMNFLPALENLSCGHEYWVWLGTHQHQLEFTPAANFHLHRIKFLFGFAASRLAWQQVILPLYLRKYKIDALLSTMDYGPLWPPCPVVIGIRNPNPYSGPAASNLTGRLREALLRGLTRISARKADAIFLPSRSFHALVQSKLALDPAKTVVIYHGISDSFFAAPSEVKGRPQLQGIPYILSVSPVRIHKDFKTLLHALKKVSSGVDPKLVVVIAGAITDSTYYKGLLRLIEQEGLQGRILFLGELPYEEMPSLYRGAQLFVLTSLAETFGHPLVEAMASGVPVVATDFPVMREVCGTAAMYFRPGDASDLAQKMCDLLTDQTAREDLRKKGVAQARAFSWQNTALQTVALLEKVAARGKLHEG